VLCARGTEFVSRPSFFSNQSIFDCFKKKICQKDPFHCKIIQSRIGYVFRFSYQTFAFSWFSIFRIFRINISIFMKIAFIGQKGIPALYGGIERYVENLSIGLAKLNHGVCVYTRPYYTSKKLKEYQAVKLICLPSIHTKHLDTISHVFFATIHALFKDYDIIHYQNVGPALLAWIPRLFKPHTKVIVTFQCLDRKHQKWGRLARFFLKLGELSACKFPHETICVSKTLQEYCRNNYQRQTTYIPNGASNISNSLPSFDVLQKLNLENGRYLLVVSRLIRHKGIHYLIDAFLNLKTDLKLAIVGNGFFTDAYVLKIKKMSKNDSRVIFAGFQTGPDLAALYQNCYFYVHPSESEGMSLSILEAMSFSKAVLASDITENLEVIGSAGLAFKNKDVADLKQKIEFLISQPEIVSRLGEQGNLRANQEYNWGKIVDSTINVYNSNSNCQSRALPEYQAPFFNASSK